MSPSVSENIHECVINTDDILNPDSIGGSRITFGVAVSDNSFTYESLPVTPTSKSSKSNDGSMEDNHNEGSLANDEGSNEEESESGTGGKIKTIPKKRNPLYVVDISKILNMKYLGLD